MPDTDLFASFELPTSINKMEGCFLSLIQRKVGFLSVFKLLIEQFTLFWTGSYKIRRQIHDKNGGKSRTFWQYYITK